MESSETPETRAEQYRQEALEIAQRISQRWKELRDAKIKNPALLEESPKLEEIDSLTAPPESGIQKWFEGQLRWIDEHAGGDAGALSRMTYRLKEDLEQIEKSVTEVLG